MLTLCGFSASNYYNKVKLALLEKQLPFDEELAWIGETDMALSPLGKVPYLRIADGRGLCESAAMAEYVESLSPSPPCCPPMPSRPPRCASCACSWTCIWNWSHATSIRRPSSAARSATP